MIEWEKLVAEHDEWEQYNFPDAGIEDAILGCIEECGELAHAHLKAMQGIRGSSADHVADAKDAVADITIYLLGVMSACRDVPRHTPPLDLMSEEWAIKHLSHEVGMVALNPTIYGCERVIHCLRAYCDFRAWDYETIVPATWARVKSRDWVKYPHDGVLR